MSYNSELQSNNADLQNILNIVNALPDAGGSGGITLPELGDTAAQPTDMAVGKVLYDDEGNPVTGTVATLSNIQVTTDNTSVQHNGTSIYVTGKRRTRAILEAGATLRMDVSAAKFGDAQQSQVLEGTTFTSSNGLCLPGRMKAESGGVQMYVDGETLVITGAVTVENETLIL